MSTSVKRRWTTRAISVGLSVAALVFLPSSAFAGVQLVPDLQTLAPRDFKIQVTSSGQRRLRFSNEVANAGSGTTELIPRAEDCNGDGKFGNDRTAYQRVYEDADGNGYFQRGIDTAYAEIKAGCMIYHAAHDHWHFEGFARYVLQRLSDRVTIRSSQKVSFCLMDTFLRYSSLNGAPVTAYYDSCSRNGTQGISVGWGDVYSARLPGQWIVINNVPNGDYCVRSTVDPEGRIQEENDANNVGTRAVRISGKKRVSVLSTPC